jgi:hypothetical protein
VRFAHRVMARKVFQVDGGVRVGHENCGQVMIRLKPRKSFIVNWMRSAGKRLRLAREIGIECHAPEVAR